MLHNPVLIHVGYIKTATTFLQNRVFSGQVKGIELAAANNTRALLVENIVLADDYGFDSSKVHEQLEKFAGAARNRGNLPVWSEETLLGDPPTRRYDGYRNACKLHSIYPNALIFITIRRQQSIALSMYREYVLGGGTLPLVQFIGDGHEPLSFSSILRDNFLLYDKAIKFYMDLFGRERVLVLPYEMLNLNASLFLENLINFTGGIVEDDISKRHDHVGESFPTMVMRRISNKITQPNPLRPGRHGFAAAIDRGLKQVDRIVPSQLSDKLFSRYRGAIEKRYHGIFLESNISTSYLIGLDLGQFGYDL